MNPTAPTPNDAAQPLRLRIATRASPLALWQAHHVRDRLLAAHPGIQIEILEFTTRGDQILDRALSKVGGKGLFVKELEVALLEGRADLAVHSLKDVPMQLAPEFELATVLERADPRDALVCGAHARLADLPPGARVGTSSLRREMTLRARYPHLQISSVRGNVGTRLAKLDRGEFDALVMAVSGLERLGLHERIREVLDTDAFLPAPGQGALGIETRAGDTRVAGLLACLEHPPTRARVCAERAVSRGLGGSCEFPLAAYAQFLDSGELMLRAWAGSAVSGRLVQAQATGPDDAAEALGAYVVARLKAQGVEALLAEGRG
jgi:hydroxymethylbilane synthase